jgi:hypothetical protein
MRSLVAPLIVGLAVGGAPALAATPGEATVAQAESLAAEAEGLVASQPKEALVRARKALAMTVAFDPMAFVGTGRKGEVVEDEFQAARQGYRRHRAKLYGAMGEALRASGDAAAASRYLRRASLLDPHGAALRRAGPGAVGTGPRSRGHGRLEKTVGLGGFPADAIPLVTSAVDTAGWPSAQVEIDRARWKAVSATHRRMARRTAGLSRQDGLSTNPVFRLDESAITVLYAAETSCRTCSEDLEGLRRAVRPGVRMLAVPEVDGQDHALRQVLQLYRLDWPLLLAPGLAQSLNLPPRTVLVVARGGWAQVLVKPPFMAALTTVLGLFGQTDVQETVPRRGWNRRPVDRRAAATEQPALLAEGLAPSEDLPAPAEWDAAVAAFRAGKKAEALRLFEALEAKGDGQLLPRKPG